MKSSYIQNIVLAAVLGVSVNVVLVNSFGFTLKAGTKKCFADHARRNELFKGEYEISSDQRNKVHLTIKDIDTGMHLLYNKDNATKAKFAFTFDKEGMFDMCFKNKAHHGSGADRIVMVKIKRGSDAKNYDDIATAQKLAPRERELMYIVDQADELVRSMAQLIHRGEGRLLINESTSTRVLYLGVLLTFLLIGMTSGQLYYLHRYFTAKKLI